MSYPHILEWSPILIRENVIQLVKRFQSFHNMTKNCMFPIEIVYVVRKCDEELAATAAFLAVQRRCYSHGHRAFTCVLQLWHDFWGKIPGGCGILLFLRGNEGPY
jgi:hypothetical protein